MARKHSDTEWDAARIAQLVALVETYGPRPKGLARLMGLTQAQVSNAAQRFAAQYDAAKLRYLAANPGAQFLGAQPPILRPLPPVEPPPYQDGGEDDATFLQRVLTATGRKVEQAENERIVRLTIATDRPIGLSMSSDWHLTSRGATDVEGFLAYADAVKATPHLYAVGVGDHIDNPIKHKPTATGDIPDDLRLLDLAVGRFGGKLLGITSGNHDDWSEKLAGADHLAALARRRRVHYRKDELWWLVDLVDPTAPEVVTATYFIVTRHKFRRHSQLNWTHACWRYREEMQGEFPTRGGLTLLPDVVALGDNHVASVEARAEQNKTAWAVRMGTWQRGSAYGRALGFARSRATAPVAILWPDEHRVEVYEDYRRGIEALAAVG